MTKDEIKARVDLVQLIQESGIELHKIGKEWTGRCPLHDDSKASLSVNPDLHLWNCFGCGKGGDCFDWVQELRKVDFKTACAQLQGQCGGISTERSTANMTVWDIRDVDGNLIAQHVRHDLRDGKKTFTWRRDGQETLGNIKVKDLPLYNLKALVGAAPGADVIITEGEKAADSLQVRGLLALGTVTGASSCPSQVAFEPLIGSRRVYLWPDNDAVGYAHMDAIAKVLQKLGIEPYLIRWPEAPAKGDAADFTGDVNSLLAAAQPWPSATARPEMVTSDESIEQRIKLLSGNSIILRAENIRRERNGVHSRITICLDSDVLAWDVFNIERNEERQRLARSAVDRLPDGIDNLCDLARLKGYLDAFTASLWEKAQERDKAEEEIPSGVTKPLVYLAEPYILRGGKTILYAPPGSGKSYTALLLAVSVDAGCSKLWNVLKAKVLFVNLERSQESVSRRLGMVNQALGLPITRPLLMLHRSGRTLADVADVLQRDVIQRGVQLVILDSISRAGAGDLVDNQTANTITDILSRICSSWLALAHSPRADATHAFGSVHFDAGADLAVQLTSETVNDTLGVGLKITKSNDVPPGPVRALAIEFAENSISVRQARPSEFGELTLAHKKSLSQEVREFLQTEGEATASQISEKLGRNRTNVATLLNSEAFCKTRKEGKSQFYGVKETRLL